MTATSKLRLAPWLNSLLGMVLILVALLDIVLLTSIGWSDWRRAMLGEQLLRIRQEDHSQEGETSRQANDLRALILAGRQNASELARAFPSDVDAARYISDLRSEAVATGVTITDLRAEAAGRDSVPMRRFVLRARGPYPQLVQFLALAAQTALPTARIEQVVLQQGEVCELSFELVIAVRPLDPWVAEAQSEPESHPLSQRLQRQE